MTAENDWITDRRPTEADGDRDGDVRMRQRPGSQLWLCVHWSCVGAGAQWQHTNFWVPPAPEPAPAAPAPKPVVTKPPLAVGQTWRRRDGEVVTIDAFIRHDHASVETHPFVVDGTCTCTYTADGIWSLDGKPTEYDLVELISEAEPQHEPPTTTPRKFVALTRTVHAFGHTLDAIDEDGVAWWMVLGTDEGPVILWTQLEPLPAREVQAND